MLVRTMQPPARAWRSHSHRPNPPACALPSARVASPAPSGMLQVAGSVGAQMPLIAALRSAVDTPPAGCCGSTWAGIGSRRDRQVGAAAARGSRQCQLPDIPPRPEPAGRPGLHYVQLEAAKRSVHPCGACVCGCTGTPTLASPHTHTPSHPHTAHRHAYICLNDVRTRAKRCVCGMCRCNGVLHRMFDLGIACITLACI